MNLPPILIPEEVAPLLRCSARTVEDRLRVGDLPGEKFGEGWILPTQALIDRVNEIAVEKMLERRKAANDLPRPRLVSVGGKAPGRAPPRLE